MSKFKDKYEERFMFYEFIISIILSIAIFHFVFPIIFPDGVDSWLILNKKDIYSLLASIAGTLLGFVITGVSVILAFSESEKLKMLRKSKHYKTIFVVYFSTIRWLALTTILSIVWIFTDFLMTYAFYLLTWSVIISSLRIGRCIWILEAIVEIVIQD
ncbi:hypothetical protein [uncultured Methanolobus sp.]|uniref:hypothetical protein n=1 Tax=uncultured Methanolobus sp. TaxID=218300 RepID=UPI002AAB7DBA|nr:hypothetical protein [uncultured Methanolobus sp.]